MKSAPYTQVYNSRISGLITSGAVGDAFEPGECSNHPPMVDINCYWDTGAVQSVLSNSIIERLGLVPVDAGMSVHAFGTSMVNVYYVNLRLPNGIEISNLRVIGGVLPGVDMLVGMDVINLCDFALTHPGENTKFSFQIPSSADIDFRR